MGHTEEEWGTLGRSGEHQRRVGDTGEEPVKSLGLTGTVNPTEPIVTGSFRDPSSKDKVDLRKVHVWPLMCTCTHSSANTLAHRHTYLHTHTPLHAHTPANTHALARTDIPTYTHTDTPTCTHTYLHTHT